MNLSPDSNFMTSLVDELEEQSNKVLSDALNVACLLYTSDAADE